MRLRARLAAGCLVLLWISGAGRATSVRVVNLPEMVDLADRIFYGRCLSAEETDSNSRLQTAVVAYRFQVLEGIKGTATGDTVEFRQVRTALGGGGGLPGLPAYRKGEEVLLFLHGDSRLGLTSPVGLIQGAFQKRVNEQGEPAFINQVENRNLTHELGTSSALEAGINTAELETIQQGHPIPLRVFVSIIRKLDNRQDAQRGSLK